MPLDTRKIKSSSISWAESDAALLEAVRRERGERSRSETIRHLVSEEAERLGIDEADALRQWERRTA